MADFMPFKKFDKLAFDSFIQVPRELFTREEYKELTPNAIILFSILADRLSLSYKQIDKNAKVKFYDEKGNMYVIFKRDEIQEKLHLKRTALDNAIQLLKNCKLIEEKCQGRNKPNIIYLGKTIGMIENEKIVKFRDVQNQHSGVHKTNNQECTKPAFHNSYNNINKKIIIIIYIALREIKIKIIIKAEFIKMENWIICMLIWNRKEKVMENAE